MNETGVMIEKQTASDRHVRHVLRTVFFVLLALAFAFVLAAAISLTWNSDIAVSHYTVNSEKAGEGFRIVLISDLHRKKFDETNELLVTRAREQTPDLILVDGDMLERDCTDEEADELASLFERLIAIAPVYFSVGNHDAHAYFDEVTTYSYEYVGFSGPSAITEKLEATGAKLLESEYVEIELNGASLRIGGFYPPAYRMDGEGDGTWLPRKAFLEDYCATDRFKLLLSHRPGAFYEERTYEDWEIDLVVSGHTHNGVIALPFGLGAIWTSEGFFPKHDMGIFEEGSITMIITSGLDGHNSTPRVFNPPEIAVIDVLP